MPGYGMAGFIGFAKEASGGTPVAASNYIEAMSESFSTEIERFDVKNMVGRYSEPDDQTGIVRNTGGFVTTIDPANAGFFLLGGMGTLVSSLIAGGLYQHKATFRTSDWDTVFPQQPFTFEVFRDVTSSQQYAGNNFTTLEFNIAPNQGLQLTAGVIGKSVLNIAKTTPTFVTSPVLMMAFDTCSVSIAGAASSIVEGLTLSIDNQLEGVPVLNNSTTIYKIRRTGPQMIRLSGSLSFEDITEYQNFINQTEQRFTVSLFRPTSFKIQFDMPRVVYTTFPTGVSDRGRQIIGFEGICRYHAGSGSALTADLYNVTSSY